MQFFEDFSAAKQLYEDLIWPLATTGTLSALPRRDPLAAVNVTVRTALIRIIELVCLLFSS